MPVRSAPVIAAGRPSAGVWARGVWRGIEPVTSAAGCCGCACCCCGCACCCCGCCVLGCTTVRGSKNEDCCCLMLLVRPSLSAGGTVPSGVGIGRLGALGVVFGGLTLGAVLM